MAGPLTDTRQWQGCYRGSYDGRAATLQVNVRQDGASRWHFDFTFTDFAGHHWVGGYSGDVGSRCHALETPIELRSVENQEPVHWKGLYLDTWDTDWLTGVSEWAGQEYGMSFVREHSLTPPLAFSGPRMASYRDFTDLEVPGWVGNADGKGGALLTITFLREFGIACTQGGEIWLRGVDLRRDEHGVGHVLRDLTLMRLGVESLHWKALYLHTWDVNFVSGISEWHGERYGMAFQRLHPRRRCAPS
jgi:hypothetical protein